MSDSGVDSARREVSPNEPRMAQSIAATHSKSTPAFPIAWSILVAMAIVSTHWSIGTINL